MSGQAIRFYFDYLSPNAYLAWTQLPALAERNSCVIEPVPVLFAGLLEANRQLGPAEVPAKMRWMWTNVLRKAALIGVPLNAPPFHPFNPLLALRVSSLELDAKQRLALIDALFAAVWVRGLHIAEPSVVEKVATETGLDGGALITRANQPECKAQLRSQTDRAIAGGVFGVPTMVVGDQLFWGFDDLAFLQIFLDGADPIDRMRWDKSVVPQSAAARSRTR
ncbi:MAG: DsbA family protein [Burkholderiaceae bacterium]